MYWAVLLGFAKKFHHDKQRGTKSREGEAQPYFVLVKPLFVPGKMSCRVEQGIPEKFRKSWLDSIAYCSFGSE